MVPCRVLVPIACWCLLPVAPAQTHLFTKPGASAGDAAGSAVAVVGDVDGDGAQDFAVGSPFHDAAGGNAGQVIVYSGRTSQPIRAWYGSGPGQRFGHSIAGVGDLDSDGHADVAVGAIGGDSVDVLSGQSGLALHHFTGPSGSWFGFAVAGGGELDGDGVPDILIGMPEGPGYGALYVHSGASGALIRAHQGQPTLGWSAAFLGDADGDGLDEYVTGEPGNFYFNTPTVHAFDGATGAVLWTDSSLSWNDQYGWSVARLGDVTGDGIPEILAGAPQDPGVGCGGCTGKGFVRLLDGATGVQVWQIGGGPSFYSGFGYSLTGVGDLDGDGVGDFAASRPATEGCGGNTQKLDLRSGALGALIVDIQRPTSGDGFGFSLASGDVNDDGLRDLLVGTPCDDAGGADSGASYAYTIVRVPTAYCEAKTNSLGCTPAIHATGEPSLTTNTFRVRASEVLNNKSGLLFWGLVPFAKPFQGGTKCVDSPAIRTPLQSSGGNSPPDDCSGAFVFHFSGAYLTNHGVPAGTQVFCQYWARDPAAVAGTSLTGGLAFLVEP